MCQQQGHVISPANDLRETSPVGGGVWKREQRLRGATVPFRNVQMLKISEDSRDSCGERRRDSSGDTLVTPSDFSSWLGSSFCPILAPQASGTFLNCCQLPVPNPSGAQGHQGRLCPFLLGPGGALGPQRGRGKMWREDYLEVSVLVTGLRPLPLSQGSSD